MDREPGRAHATEWGGVLINMVRIRPLFPDARVLFCARVCVPLCGLVLLAIEFGRWEVSMTQ